MFIFRTVPSYICLCCEILEMGQPTWQAVQIKTLFSLTMFCIFFASPKCTRVQYRSLCFAALLSLVSCHQANTHSVYCLLTLKAAPGIPASPWLRFPHLMKLSWGTLTLKAQYFIPFTIGENTLTHTPTYLISSPYKTLTAPAQTENQFLGEEEVLEVRQFVLVSRIRQLNDAEVEEEQNLQQMTS